MSNIGPPTIVKSPSTSRVARRQSTAEDPPTLSGFKYLKRLAVLNIDCLDLIPEIKSCISKSESTLGHLSLSFSNFLAQEAREADADQDYEATEPDDDIHDPQQSSSTRPPRAQKEWRIQETVLARILGVEKGRSKAQPPSQGAQGERDGSDTGDGSQNSPKPNKKKSPEEVFIAALKQASEKLLSIQGAEGLAGHSDGIVNVIGEAVGGYFASDAAKQRLAVEGNDATVAESSEQSPGFENMGGLSTLKSHARSSVKSSADSISFELSEPEEDESLDSEPNDGSESSRDKPSFVDDAENCDHDGVWSSSSRQGTGLPVSVASPGEQAKRSIDDDEAEKKQLMSAYVKSTRGLGLTSLSLHLIPVKASVLNNALDLHALQSLTLLNVGNQAPLWTLLSKENHIKPLALRNIFTDNVSPAFLKCMSQIEKLYELFMIERSSRYRPATFVPWTTVTIHDIRKQVLKRHSKTLKRLMIRNDASAHWDLDAKTIILLCARGIVLEELSAGFHMRGVVSYSLTSSLALDSC